MSDDLAAIAPDTVAITAPGTLPSSPTINTTPPSAWDAYFSVGRCIGRLLRHRRLLSALFAAKCGCPKCRAWLARLAQHRER